jgi:hypothetical protein
MTNTLTALNPRINCSGSDSADPATLIVAETVSVVLDRFQSQLRAIVLTGSMARGEASFVQTPGGWNTLGDCEMVLVFKSNEPLPSLSHRANIQREIELRLQQLGIVCPLGLSPVHSAYLLNLAPSIYGYELRRCGRVVWGDTSVLTLIPEFSPRDIPREDALKMICNRMIEHLMVDCGYSEHNPSGRTIADYATVKLSLDLATSYLIFAGEFVQTYGERSSRLLQLADKMSANDDVPFPLGPFAALVKRLTFWKLSSDSGVLTNEPLLMSRVRDYARRLWRWELRLLTGDRQTLPDQDLMRRWMRSQSLPQRIRGWASLARKSGGLGSWKEWPHWTRLGLSGSPRHWIYAAGSGLFFQLPFLAGDSVGARPNPSLQMWRGWLPARPKQEKEQRISWHQLASEINWNYRNFLMETNA